MTLPEFKPVQSARRGAGDSPSRGSGLESAPVEAGGLIGAGLRRPSRLAVARLAFSLIEVLIAVTLMSVIVLGLMTMFSQTQRAFRAGITQVDVLESGRAALELMAREIEQAKPTDLPYSTNFFAVWNGYFLTNALPGASYFRTNIQQNIHFVTRENQTWTGIGYAVEYTNYLGTLYRYETNASQLDSDRVWWLARNVFYATNSRARVVDGVVSLRLQAYDTFGRLLSPYNPAKVWPQVVTLDNVPGELSYDYYFVSNAVPAYVELELGILEAKTAERARNLPFAAQRQFLEKQAGKIQVFRQRIPIRNVDPSVYQ
jgi:Tfp pilus assembly protein PilV